MSSKDTPQITTQRLLLRGKFRKDAAGILNYYTDPKVRPWLGGFPYDSMPEIRRAVSGDKSKSSFVIIERATNRVIGEIDIYNIIQNRIANIGYILLSECWGRGYMLEAAAPVLRMAFVDMRLSRLRACIMQDNTRSRKLVERLGFDFECSMKEADFGGRVEDVCYYSLSREKYLRDTAGTAQPAKKR
ncbi:MAG: GNAT family N-acetyltransferase [Clostridia bacterium]|nr:GNAT family N-acetyltransferase [Clostridia bacterium]